MTISDALHRLLLDNLTTAVILLDEPLAGMGTAEAERMIERDKVTCILGEISSASCLTISQVAARNKTLFVNTGGNSDALRGESCNRYMFHVEHQNSMYVKSCGRSLMAAWCP